MRPDDYRASRIADKVRVFDRFGRLVFEIDRWLYEELAKRGVFSSNSN